MTTWYCGVFVIHAQNLLFLGNKTPYRLGSRLNWTRCRRGCISEQEYWPSLPGIEAQSYSLWFIRVLTEILQFIIRKLRLNLRCFHLAIHEPVWEETPLKLCLQIENSVIAHRFRKADTIAEINIQLRMEVNSRNVLVTCTKKGLTDKTGWSGGTSGFKCLVSVRFRTQNILIEIYHGSIQSLRFSVGISPRNKQRSLPLQRLTFRWIQSSFHRLSTIVSLLRIQ